MAGPIAAAKDGFLDRLKIGKLPTPRQGATLKGVGLEGSDLAGLFESQASSRRLDLEARRLGAEKRGFYSIGSAGHEGNAGFNPAGDQGLDLDSGGLRTFNPDIITIPDAGIIGIARMHFNEHILLQFRQPGIGPCFIATALVFNKASGSQDDRIIL